MSGNSGTSAQVSPMSLSKPTRTNIPVTVSPGAALKAITRSVIFSRKDGQFSEKIHVFSAIRNFDWMPATCSLAFQAAMAAGSFPASGQLP